MAATPVTPAALSPERATELRSTLRGSWKLVEERVEGGQRKPVDDTTALTFSDNGTVFYQYIKGLSLMSWGVNVGRKYSYKMDGANMSFEPAFLTLRVDKWDDKTLEVFVYDYSYHWYFERLPEQPPH